MSIPDSSGQAVANLTEITVRTDLTTLEGNLEAVGGGVSAVRRAKAATPVFVEAAKAW